jgi:hypothetical protein
MGVFYFNKFRNVVYVKCVICCVLCFIAAVRELYDERVNMSQCDIDAINAKSNGVAEMLCDLAKKHGLSKGWAKAIGAMTRECSWHKIRAVLVIFTDLPPILQADDTLKHFVDVGPLLDDLAGGKVSCELAMKVIMPLLKAGATYDKTKCPTTGHHPLYVALSAGLRHTNCKLRCVICHKKYD